VPAHSESVNRSFNPPFSHRYYADDPLVVAPGLLGALLIHNHPDRGLLAGRIVETEAYRGMEDQACHASKGQTKRTAPMFGPPGHAYVYLIYGMYEMFNVVTWPEGEPSAVLIRGVEPIAGIEGTTNGPGKLTRALHIDRRLNESDLVAGPLIIVPDQMIAAECIETSPRIGVGYAGEWTEKPWRFSVRDNPHVSKPPKRRSTTV
jgi:DNA-3-methyladenine glycosylase